MPTYAKFKLSASTNGRGVLITGTTSGAGTAVHTAVNVANQMDEVWLWAVNHGSAEVDLTVQAGGTTSGDEIPVGIPPRQGLVAVLPGFVYSGGVAIAAFAAVASGITLHGFVNRLDQA